MSLFVCVMSAEHLDGHFHLQFILRDIIEQGKVLRLEVPRVLSVGNWVYLENGKGVRESLGLSLKGVDVVEIDMGIPDKVDELSPL